MKTDFLENNHVIHVAPNTLVAANEDIFNGSPASDVISLKTASGAVFIIATNANAGGNATVQVYSCDDVTPTNTVPIAFKYRRVTAADTQGAISDATSAGFLTSTGANMVYIIEVDARDSYDGYSYCQLKCTENTDAAVDGAIVGFRTGLRYPQNSVATAVT
jgi:hypothetical protein